LESYLHWRAHDLIEAREEMAMATVSGHLSEFKKILDRQEAELARSLRRRDDIVIEKSPDEIDEVQHAATRELAIQTLDREHNLLREVKAALLRIHDGSFGACLQCEEPISPKRLAAVPWAPLCIGCQEAADRDQYEASESPASTLVRAA
jgi:DnaK suppressor protein